MFGEARKASRIGATGVGMVFIFPAASVDVTGIIVFSKKVLELTVVTAPTAECCDCMSSLIPLASTASIALGYFGTQTHHNRFTILHRGSSRP